MSAETVEPIRSILFPTDFSPPANAAFKYAERLAASTGARLLVLHAEQGQEVASPSDLDDKTRCMLEAVQPSVPGVQVEHLAFGGPAGEVICWIAQERACDQIVMGTHGRTGLVNLLMGSVAEYVVRHARCPVLTVPSRSKMEAPLEKPTVYQPTPWVQPL